VALTHHAAQTATRSVCSLARVSFGFPKRRLSSEPALCLRSNAQGSSHTIRPKMMCHRAFCSPSAASTSAPSSCGTESLSRASSSSSAPLPAPLASSVTYESSLSQEDAELIQSLNAAVAMLGPEDLGGNGAEPHPLVEVRDKVVASYQDKAALLKRDWTDEMFQEGEEINEARVAEIEAALVGGLGSDGRGSTLADGRNLGSALDLVGAYMKNYMLDKADAVLARCGPHVSDRGGVWMIKWLNHTSTVRMKQGRYSEALEMLYELEIYSPYNAEEAPEFYETLYRNLGWALKSLGRVDEAAVYFERMAQVAQTHKGQLDWFDCWDIGKLLVMLAYRDGNMERFYRARGMVEDSLRMHAEAEPEDLVMRAKVLDSLAECFLVTKEYPSAEAHYNEAYKLLLETVGRNSPLFGKQARHSANVLIDQERHAEALPFLGEALVVEAAKDAAKVHELLDLVDLIVQTQQKCGTDAIEDLPPNHAALRSLQKNLRARGMDTSKEYAILCHKMSLMYLHEHKLDPGHLKRAVKLAKKSVELLEAHPEDSTTAEWLKMGKMHLQLLIPAWRQLQGESARKQ